ncbi:MAG TPA: hypothetical protein VFM24_06780 [Nitrospira sp.]|nr:hypothetical protein [Nitrospira sp.]
MADIGVAVDPDAVEKAAAIDWVPTAEELAKYRSSWNPPTHGTSFTSSADVTRQGQWFVRHTSKA